MVSMDACTCKLVLGSAYIDATFPTAQQHVSRTSARVGVKNVTAKLLITPVVQNKQLSTGAKQFLFATLQTQTEITSGINV